MTAVLTPPVLTRRVAAILVPAHIAANDDPIPHDKFREPNGHTWRWRCGDCGTRSFCTFPTAHDADRAGEGHQCPEPTS